MNGEMIKRSGEHNHAGDAAKVEAAILPPKRFLFPSRVVTSITDEVLPAYSAPKPAEYTSAFFMISLSKTEKSPIEWKGL